MSANDSSRPREPMQAATKRAGSGVRPSAHRQPVVLVVEGAPALVDAVRCAISAVDHTIRLGCCSLDRSAAAIQGSRPFLVVVDAELYAQRACDLQALCSEVGGLLMHVPGGEEVTSLERRLIARVAEGFARYLHDAR